MKKILITGGCGFIGSHLVEFFLKKNQKVVVFDKKGKRYEKNWLKNFKHKNLKIILDDIRNYNKLDKIIKNCSQVIHLAAAISIPHSYLYPREHVSVNILGTLNILESCKKHKKSCIITSTSETYGSGKYFPMDENHPLNAQSPYAATKISADQLALSYHNSFGLKVKIIRPFNCFGPRQSTRAVIPTMIMQLIKNSREIKIGNTNTFRDYTYVEDLCSAFWLLSKSKKGFGKVFNIGSNKTHKIKDVLYLLKKISKAKSIIKVDKKRFRPSKSEVNKLHCDNKNFLKLFKWKPSNFNNKLVDTFNWYKNNSKLFNASKYNF